MKLHCVTAYKPKNEMYFVTDVMGCTLERVLRSKQDISEAHIAHFALQLLQAVAAMHSIGVVHYEIQPSHILVNSCCDLKVIGETFVALEGSARDQDEEDQRRRWGSRWRWYCSPETMLCPDLPYHTAADLFGVGCVIAEMFLRKPMFPGDDYLHQLNLILKFTGYREEKDLGVQPSERAVNYLNKSCVTPGMHTSDAFPTASAEARNFLQELLRLNPAERPTAEQALRHPFLADAEVLHDYSRTYLTRPTPDYFGPPPLRQFSWGRGRRSRSRRWRRCRHS